MLRLYAALGFQSFNLPIYGVPDPAPGSQLMIRLVGRTYFGPQLRSDAMWSERLHGETAVDLAPETVAERGRELLSGRS